MMKGLVFWFLSAQILFLFSIINNSVSLNAQCLSDQRSYLLNFKKNLKFDLQYSYKLLEWNPEEDCCSWSGVGCDASGRVTTLELNGEWITGAADNLTSLFKLQFLEKLDLGGNDFNHIPIPKAIANLTSLVSLDLSYCRFAGQLPVELSSIHTLSDIILDGSIISTEVPEFLANMPNLRTLSLFSCNLLGQFPTKIFQVPTLQNLDISFNRLLRGRLPPFPKNSSLRKILLSYTSFSGSLPNSLGNLHMLSKIDFGYCSFGGTIPTFQPSNNLVYIDISGNNLTGSLSFAQFKGLTSLQTLNLEYNFLSGRLPSSLFKLPALRRFDLSNNQFSGQIDDIPSGLPISRMKVVGLGYNQFNGSFPKFLFQLKGLEELSLPFNSFSDTIQFETFKNLPYLTYLDLSYNNLIVEIQSKNSSLATITSLMLASCKLKIFPEMKGNTGINLLDLSNNEITGEIPNWIWNLSLDYLNLSYNSFASLQQPYNISTVSLLDLHSNQLEGEVPHLSSPLDYVDFSKNNFSGPIPSKLNAISFMSLSDNSLTGSIPNSICGPKCNQFFGSYKSNSFCGPRFIDLSNNSLIGTIPSCLVNDESRQVLKLAGNNLNGSIPDTFPANCRLITLDLGRNKLQGKLPRSLSNCTTLEVLNFGNNKIEDVFPCMFENLSSLHVLILRSNNFHGDLECFGYNYSWSQLQIIDVASNNFSGNLSSQFFSSLKNMLSLDPTQESGKVGYRNFMFPVHGYIAMGTYDYQFKVLVTMKGLDLELQKILTIFTVIDFSNNKFSGNIPEPIGDLKGLYVLDLSHNEITGGIPSGVGKLSNLGSLDLSRNQLSGEIPSTLQDLTFLTYLNLSFNMLTGKIPTGSQLQTFPNDSYIGNVGLCGFPLNVSCGDPNDSGSSSMPSLSNTKETNWMYACASVGYTVGLGIFSMFLLFCARWRNKLFLRIDQLMVNMFGPVWREPIRML